MSFFAIPFSLNWAIECCPVHAIQKRGSLVHTQQFHIEYQSGAGENYRGKASVTIGLVARNCQGSTGANRQLGNGRIPALYHLADTNITFKWTAAVTRRIELLAVFQGAGVVDRDSVSHLGKCFAVAFLEDFNLGGCGCGHG